MPNEPVQVGVRRPLNVHVSAADIVDGLIVHHEGAIRVLQRGVGCQDGVVGLNHGSGDLSEEITYIYLLLVVSSSGGGRFHL